MLRFRKLESQRVLVCVHVQEAGITGGSECVLTHRKLESQEGLGVCSRTGSQNHRRVWVCAHTQEAGITGGSGCVLRYRKPESQGFWVCAHTQETGITGGSGCVLRYRKPESQGFWVVLGVQMKMCLCSAQFPQGPDTQLAGCCVLRGPQPVFREGGSESPGADPAHHMDVALAVCGVDAARRCDRLVGLCGCGISGADRRPWEFSLFQKNERNCASEPLFKAG